MMSFVNIVILGTPSKLLGQRLTTTTGRVIVGRDSEGTGRPTIGFYFKNLTRSGELAL